MTKILAYFNNIMNNGSFTEWRIKKEKHIEKKYGLVDFTFKGFSLFLVWGQDTRKKNLAHLLAHTFAGAVILAIFIAEPLIFTGVVLISAAMLFIIENY